MGRNKLFFLHVTFPVKHLQEVLSFIKSQMTSQTPRRVHQKNQTVREDAICVGTAEWPTTEVNIIITNDD